MTKKRPGHDVKIEVLALKGELNMMRLELETLKQFLDEGPLVHKDVRVKVTGPPKAAVSLDYAGIPLSGGLTKYGSRNNVALDDPITLTIACKGMIGLDVGIVVEINGKTVEKSFGMESNKELRNFDLKFAEFGM
jgi:hypothetical protein